MNTSIQYCLEHGTFLSAWQDSDVGLKEKAKRWEMSKDTPCRILMRVITTSIQEEWIEPAFVPVVPSIDEAIEFSVSNSIGQRDYEWHPNLSLMSGVEQQRVRKDVFDEVSHCDNCGFIHSEDEMYDGVCSSCQNELEDEQDEETDDE